MAEALLGSWEGGLIWHVKQTLCCHETLRRTGYSYTSHFQQTAKSQTWRKILALFFKR